MKYVKFKTLREDQKESLNSWIDYFLSGDGDAYPVWIKYWSFEGMVKLGLFNEETGKFGKRSSSMVAPFPELNREAFSLVVEMLIKYVDEDSLEGLKDEKLLNLIKSKASFGKLYGRQLKLLKSVKASGQAETDGKWVKYNQGSSADELVASLKGKGTGWCTAGHSTATKHLSEGDFYVYYSKDQEEKMTNPRLAIRMNGNASIAEVRGVGADQNLDQHIAQTDILDKKLVDFGAEADRYQKKSDDMKRLTEVEKNIERVSN